MTDTPPYEDLLSLIEDRSAALREAAAAASGFEGRVPGCPEWTLADLIAHLGGVQRVWAVAVSLADPSAPPTAEQRGDLEPHGDLLEWSAESTGKLLAALRATAPDSPCWTWWAASGAPATAAAVARHQVQEAAVHAYDAQETIGKPEPLPAAVAVDGVAEFLSVGMASMGPWPNRPARVVLTAVEGPSWTLDLSPSGAVLNPPESGDPSSTVHASASDLVLALYGRIPFDTSRVEGDHSVLAEIKAWNETE
ncbi:MAG: maleylpyruvate isomerase family mycothiol-dependent enzyme [Actinoplanes sp.]